MGPEAQYEHVAQYKDGQEVTFKFYSLFSTAIFDLKIMFLSTQVVGTLSQDEWEALTIYTVFAFKKIR